LTSNQTCIEDCTKPVPQVWYCSFVIHKFRNTHQLPALPLISKVDIGDVILIDFDCTKIRIESSVRALVSLDQHNICSTKNEAELLLHLPETAFYWSLVTFSAATWQVPHTGKWYPKFFVTQISNSMLSAQQSDLRATEIRAIPHSLSLTLEPKLLCIAGASHPIKATIVLWQLLGNAFQAPNV
jgi:hypothetical protein